MLSSGLSQPQFCLRIVKGPPAPPNNCLFRTVRKAVVGEPHTLNPTGKGAAASDPDLPPFPHPPTPHFDAARPGPELFALAHQAPEENLLLAAAELLAPRPSKPSTGPSVLGVLGLLRLGLGGTSPILIYIYICIYIFFLGGGVWGIRRPVVLFGS